MGRKSSDSGTLALFIIIAILAVTGMIIEWVSENPLLAVFAGVSIGVFFILYMSATAKERAMALEQVRKAEVARAIVIEKAKKQVELEKEQARKNKEEIRIRKEKEREVKALEKEKVKKRKEAEKLEKEQNRKLEKEAKSREKFLAKKKKEAGASFSAKTLEFYKFNNEVTEYISSTKEVKYSLVGEQKIIEIANIDYFKQKRKITSRIIDELIFSGRYNSVLGIEGLQIFKRQIQTHLEEQISQEKDEISIDNIFLKDLVFLSGLYFEYEEASNEIKALESKYEWRGLHRLILTKELAKDLKSLNIGSYRTNHSKLFHSYTDEEEKSLIIAIHSIADEMQGYLNEYFNNTYNMKKIA